MKKTDINQYTTNTPPGKGGGAAGAVAASTTKRVLGIIWKVIATVFLVGLVTSIIVGVSVLVFILSLKDTTVDYDLRTAKMDLTSYVYEVDENGETVQVQPVYAEITRNWVNFDDIPQAMKDAMVAIEDKRFYQHEGVDWVRTGSAVLNLFIGGGDSYGGSTITQQLIKNITGNDEVSLTRKITEIFSALNFEKEYSKDEILEYYLNYVNFGSGANGVQAAAQLYFDKDISECSVAQCAAIAGITQNPSLYSPLLNPDQNKERREVVLQEMLNQGMLTQEEYDAAMAESATMTFAEGIDDDEDDYEQPTQSWYTDLLLENVQEDLMEELNIGKDAALDMMQHGGLEIYSAVDRQAQNILEAVVQDSSNMPNLEVETGVFVMDYNGRVLATVGSRNEKEGSFVYSNATDAARQPGSTMKPISVYTPALESGKYNYSTIVPDEPITPYFPDGRPGPNNWYGYFGGFQKHPMTVQLCIEVSANAPAVQVEKVVTPEVSYDFLQQKLHFESLTEADRNLSAMALGGMSEGATVEEMTAGFQIFGTGGKYYEPYTYYKVLDSDKEVILDNTSVVGEQVISSENATIMRHLLYNVVTGSVYPTGSGANIPGWQIYAKTGTSDNDHDSWFIGGTPYAIAGIWTGYTEGKDLSASAGETSYARNIWRSFFTQYLADKPALTFQDDPNVVTRQYCTETGLLAGENCESVATGWYSPNNLPGSCDGVHEGDESSSEESSEPESSAPESSEPPVSSEATSAEPPVSDPSSSEPPISSMPESSNAPVSSTLPPSQSSQVSSVPENGSSGGPVESAVSRQG